METVERAFGRNLRDFVEAGRGESIDCAGGVAAFLGMRSPLTTVKGAGASLGDADVERAEEFFRSRGGERAMFELASWAPAERLLRRGYEVVGAEDVMVRRPPFDVAMPAAEVAEVSAEEWPDLQRRANHAPDSSEWRALVVMCGALPGAMRFGVRDSGEWVACAEVMPAGDVAIFGNDATAPPARGRGAQTATIQARLRAVAGREFALVAAEVEAGSASQRNYLRCGFEVAYSRTWYARAIPR